MKVIHICDADIERLRLKLQLEKFKQYDEAKTQEERFRLQALHRKFHYEVETWIGEITR